MNNNSKRNKRNTYKHTVESTGKPPQHVPNKRKAGKVACLTFKDHNRIGS